MSFKTFVQTVACMCLELSNSLKAQTQSGVLYPDTNIGGLEVQAEIDADAIVSSGIEAEIDARVKQGDYPNCKQLFGGIGADEVWKNLVSSEKDPERYIYVDFEKINDPISSDLYPEIAQAIMACLGNSTSIVSFGMENGNLSTDELNTSVSFPKLVTCSLKGNNLSKLPDIGEKVKWLDLSENSLTEIDGVAKRFPELEGLYLDDTLVEYVSEEIWELKKLEVLKLSGTQVSFLPELTKERPLRALYASNTGLTELPDGFSKNLPRLAVLNISNTPLKHLPKDVARMPELAVLDIFNTYIEHLHEDFRELIERRVLRDGDLTPEQMVNRYLSPRYEAKDPSEVCCLIPVFLNTFPYVHQAEA